MIELLKNIEKELKHLLSKPEIWHTLDVDYYPPRVERLWCQYEKEHRLYIHYIHTTDSACLFHKHRWPAAFKVLEGSYEMGLVYSEKEISTDEAYNLPYSKIILNEGSYYEMTNTHLAHYVKPLDKPSYSLMVTGSLYKEAEIRKEILDKPLSHLSEERKLSMVEHVKSII